METRRTRLYDVQKQDKEIPKLPDPGELEPYDMAELPKGAERNHHIPNACLQTSLFGMVQRGRRKYVEKKQIYSFQGFSVYFTGGELDQGDLDVFLHAIHLAAKQQATGNRKKSALVEFSVRSYLQALGKQPGKSGQDWLLNSIRRLSACLVEVHLVNSRINARFGSIYGGSLIYDFYYDPGEKRFYLRINDRLGSLFRMGWTSLHWKQRLQLKTGLAKWLHGLYSSTDVYPMKVETLRRFSRSRCKRLSKFRALLKSALDELIVAGVILEWEIDREDKVHVIRLQQQKVDR
jgi:hypothetical protein